MSALKLWSVKYHLEYPGGNRSSLSLPRTKFGAWIVRLFSLERAGWKRTIVNHDDEMRAWGRHDFVHYPTAEDLLLAAEDAKYVIPSLAPGESVRVSLPLRGSDDATKKKPGVRAPGQNKR